jgi:hypothetical protein
MFQDAFYKPDISEAQTILGEVAPYFPGITLEPDGTTLLAYDLPFYPGHRLIEITRADNVPLLKRMVVYKPGHVTVLNWTNAPVYQLNAAVPLTLSYETAPDYVRFFFSVVRGRHGAFHIVESAGDIPWREEPPATARKAVSRMIQPVQVTADNGNGAFDLSTCLLFKTALFRTTAHVARNGTVTLQNEELLAEDMPVRDMMLGV